MGKQPPMKMPSLCRRSFLVAGAATVLAPRTTFAQGAGTIRIGVPTKTYWPTIICETAIRQKLFEKEGIKAELTIYRSGAEGFEAIAAGATDLILNSSSSVAGGLRKGVNVRCVANGANGYYGWYLVVKTDSADHRRSSELAGKKVGITSAGSGTDILALWTLAEHKIDFTRVPLGGGGLVPNLLTGNIDASVLYSPLTYKVIDEKVARPLIDYGAEVPAHSTGSWIASDKIIKERPQVVQKALNAIYGGVAFLRDDANRAAAVKLVAEIDEIPEAIAARELDGNIKKLSATGEMKLEWMERALDMGRLIGMKDLAPAKDIFIEQFKPVPTAALTLSESASRSHAMRAGRRDETRAIMTRAQIILIRLALLALVLGAWELLPRSGAVNPLLLPPLSDVLAMLANLLGRAERAGGGRRHRVGGGRRLHHRRAARRRGRHPDRRERLSRADLQADAVLRVQHPQIDLPADVHSRVRHRLSAEGRLCRLHDGLRRADERHGGGGVGARRPRHGGALLRRDADADPVAHLRAEHAADPARNAAHLDDLQLHRRDDRRDVRIAHRDRPPDRQLGRELPDAAAVRRRDRAVGRGHPVQRSRARAGGSMQHVANLTELRGRTGDAAIEVEGLSHVYAGADGGVPALIDISMSVGKGRFVVIVGPSGLRQDLAADDAGGPAPPDRRARSCASASRSPSPIRNASASSSRRRACFPGSRRSTTSSFP